MPDIVASRPTSGQPIETGWGDEVHDNLEGIQYGSFLMPSAVAGNASATITFPRPYVSPPVVIVGGPGAPSFFVMQVGAITTTNFVALVRDLRDAQAGTGATTLQWVAFGKPA